jgi:hypothetical protein
LQGAGFVVVSGRAAVAPLSVLGVGLLVKIKATGAASQQACGGPLYFTIARG